MKEVEILVKVYSSPEEAIKILEKFEFLGINKTVDTYFYDPLRDNLKPNEKLQIDECFRVRTKNDINTLTYKVDKFDKNGKWLYSDEYETKFEDMYMLNEIIKKLGLKELITIYNSKRIYKYDDYEIVFETVKDLGYFIEVEYCTNEDINVVEVKKEIQSFIDNLGLKVSNELNIGKPEMMLKKINGKVSDDEIKIN